LLLVLARYDQLSSVFFLVLPYSDDGGTMYVAKAAFCIACDWDISQRPSRAQTDDGYCGFLAVVLV
jgi:hypothetical protein